MVNVDKIIDWIKKYFVNNGPDCKAVIGISGGKDSTIAAALLVRALGRDNVVAVKMPQGVQKDIQISNEVIRHLGITNVYEIDIGPVCEATLLSLPAEMRALPQVYTNIPPRERMKVLYAIAAGVHGRVVNTSNASERYVGYCTKFGDTAGDFAPLANYYVEEILEIGRALQLPSHLIYKTPEDGLSGKTDAENLGFSYAELDNYLIRRVTPQYPIYKNIEERHKRNRHKCDRLPTCPRFTDDKDDYMFNEF